MLVPPDNETEHARQARIAAEMEAKRVSDGIDEELQREEKALKRGEKPLKILLLAAFRTERASWRAVIHLNVVRSIRIILEAMSEAQVAAPLGRAVDPELPTLTAEHLKLKMRLSPLLQVEEALIRKLTPAGSAEYEATQLAQMTKESYMDRVRVKEVAVNSQFAWKGVFTRLMPGARASMDSEVMDWENPERMQDPGRILHACSEDMIRLWGDETIQVLLRAKHLRLEDQPGFFLDSLQRVTAPRYMPTDDDILRARLKTLGITEYRFSIKEGTGLGATSREWRIYDVGGQRSLVTAWAPYFDDMNAILFLAPISCFDQVLVEDPNVNRLEDSVLLWKSIVSNPLLSNTSIAKLGAGIELGKYIISYGNRPNDFESTSAYLRRKFAQIHKEHSPVSRSFYCHFTSVTDVEATSNIIMDVQDTVILKNLRQSRLIA
ncbi:G-protein alpha subunit [Amylocystis lapponica]|nr:G-protein alpha subunit [Amylocystis lapponica]